MTQRVNKNHDPDDEVKRFLDSWSNYADQEADCPPDYFLVEASKADLEVLSFPKDKQKASWLNHLRSCPHCRDVIKLLRDPAPSKLTVQHILARASRDAEEIMSRPRDWKQTRHRLFSWSHDSNPLRTLGLQPIAAALLVVVLLGGLWGVKRSGFFETPSKEVTASFPRDEARELLQTLQADVSNVQNTRIPRQDEQKYVAEYQQNYATIKRLKQEQKLPAEYRRDIALLMAQYKSEVEQQIARNRETKPTYATSALETEADTQAIFTLVNNVEHALSKKNVDTSDVKTEVPDPQTITTVFEQIDVKMNDSEVTVVDKNPNRAPAQAELIFKGVQWYAAQEKRSVFLDQGNERKTITAASTFTQRPNQ